MSHRGSGDLNGSSAAGDERFVVGVDIGGTFTDIILVDGAGRVVDERKVPSTPPLFGEGVVYGLSEMIAAGTLRPGAVAEIMHGTTVATNAILERRGARTALLTTKGFRDVLELGRMRHPGLYDVFWERPEPLVPRQLRFEVAERMASDGSVMDVLEKESITRAAERLKRARVKAVAISFINAYANPQHEQHVAEHMRRVFPTLFVSVSTELLPEVREYERTSTTVVNAYIGPIVDSYLQGLDDALAGIGVNAELKIMYSNGGLAPVREAIRAPVRMVESGPAAGVTAARVLISETERRDAISFDMGGTTAKLAIMEDGTPVEAHEYDVGGGMNVRRRLMGGGGYTLRVPSIDIAEVGAGGGSVFWLDEAGVPHVGPESAGATPGPACYGRGGDAPTLTDAAVVLGYLNNESLAGGAQPIDFERARSVIAEQVARPLKVDLKEAAYGIYRIAVANMSRAVRAVTTERGRDARAFDLVAFGGAGPLHAVAIATEFNIPRVIVPIASGLFSTVGLLVADVEHDSVASYPRQVEMDARVVERIFERLYGESVVRLDDDGYDPSSASFERYVDARYVGQSYELRLPIASESMTEDELVTLRETFDAEHLRTYGHSGASGERMELVNLRIRTRTSVSAEDRFQAMGAGLRAFAKRTAGGGSVREAYFGPDLGVHSVPVISRWELTRRERPGPLIIEDMDATTLIPPGSGARLDQIGNIVVRLCTSARVEKGSVS